MTMIIEYFEALKRLKEGTPLNVPHGAKINNDNVALEAGRKKGSIKKGRKIFSALIAEIKDAQSQPEDEMIKMKEKLIKFQSDRDKYKEFYESALARELMLINKINELEMTFKQLHNKKISRLL